MKNLVCWMFGLVLAAQVANAGAPRSIELFPEGVPNLNTNLMGDKVVSNRIVSVQKPSMLVFKPAASNDAHTAVVFCSGGGYVRISVPDDGGDLTRQMTAQGLTVFMLKYRLADYGHPAALQDVLRAVRVVRLRAEEFGVGTNRIGVMGASAGGHLAACAATLWDSPMGKTGADLDNVSARPDFAVLIYPVITMAEKFVHKGSRDALLGKSPSAELLDVLSVEKQVRKDSPPMFLAATMADRTVPVENTLHFYQACRDANVPAEMHVYAQGSHGNSQDPQYGPTAEWPKRMEEWLRFNGWLNKTN